MGNQNFSGITLFSVWFYNFPLPTTAVPTILERQRLVAVPPLQVCPFGLMSLGGPVGSNACEWPTVRLFGILKCPFSWRCCWGKRLHENSIRSQSLLGWAGRPDYSWSGSHGQVGGQSSWNPDPWLSMSHNHAGSWAGDVCIQSVSPCHHLNLIL